MIWDYENMFLVKKAGTTYGTTATVSDNVVSNGNGGNAYESAFVVIAVTDAATAGGNLTVDLETSDAENFGTKTDLDSYYIPTGSKGVVVKARVPFGAKKYLRLELTGSASVTGSCKISAGLVKDVDLGLSD